MVTAARRMEREHAGKVLPPSPEALEFLSPGFLLAIPVASALNILFCIDFNLSFEYTISCFDTHWNGYSEH